MGTTLLLIRHAQPAGGDDGSPRRLSGWHDTPLSPAGRSQAERLARRLRLEDLGAIYSSPLRRAAETASAIGEWTGLPVAHLPQLREIDCGEVDGQLLDHVRRAYRAHWDANLCQNDQDFRWPGGESYRELRARCLAAMARISAECGNRRVAVVTHAGVISQVIGHLRGLSPARWGSSRPGTASVTVLEWRDGSGALLGFDDRTHLSPDDDRQGLMRQQHQP